jgi:hypothetical protein
MDAGRPVGFTRQGVLRPLHNLHSGLVVRSRQLRADDAKSPRTLTRRTSHVPNWSEIGTIGRLPPAPRLPATLNY